jgi:uncharacterized membrane protein (UPF0127 family)
MRIATRTMLAGAVAVAALSACSTTAPQQTTPSPPAALGPLKPSEPFGLTAVTLRSPEGGVALAVPVYDAAVPKTRARGLMHRKRLPKRTGMVFRFADDRDGGFYMKNTLIPLSIAFFDGGGVVVDVLDMEPCQADPCPTYAPSVAYRGALEVNQGFFDRLGLRPGWRVELPPGLPPAR